MTDKINLATAAPLSEWKTRDGHKAVFGCWNSIISDQASAIGWIGNMPLYWNRDGKTDINGCDLVAPWPKEPVVFEATVFSTPIGDIPAWQSVLLEAPHVGGVHDDRLTPFIGKRVEITVRELL